VKGLTGNIDEPTQQIRTRKIDKSVQIDPFDYNIVDEILEAHPFEKVTHGYSGHHNCRFVEYPGDVAEASARNIECLITEFAANPK
jgi:hypothetical protein